MQISALQTFLTIIETGSLVRASERLNVTQSTVTARLKSLEDELGQTLMIRQKSGATLTAAGVKLKRYAEVMTELWRQARQETALPEGTQGVCNIGCEFDLWQLRGKAVFQQIRTTQPDLALSAWPGNASTLAGWMDSGLIDMAITWQPMARAGVSVHPLPAEDLILVSTDVNAPMRFDPGYVFVDGGEEFGRAHAAAYADANTANITFGTQDWGLQDILTNGGSAYLASSLAAPHLAAGRLHKIKDAPEFQRRPFLVTHDARCTGWDWLSSIRSD